MLAKVKVDPHAKNQGQRSNGSNWRVPTDKRTDTHTYTHTDATKRIIAPATRSIKMHNKVSLNCNKTGKDNRTEQHAKSM